MTELQLAEAIDASKHTVLRAIRKNLPGNLSASVEDVVQETYLRFYRALGSRAPLEGDDLQRWLYVAARNESRRAARRANREWLTLVKFDWNFGKESEKEAEEDLLAEGSRMKTEIQQLPDQFREVTLLRMNGMKLADIARHLGISVGTVKSRLARSKESLARRFQTDEAGGNA